MKKIEINEQEIFDRFHTYSVKDVEPITTELQELVKCGANEACEDSLSDKLLHVIEYCTYNKGATVKKYNLNVLVFAGEVENERVRVSWAFSKKEKELWGGSMLIAWGNTDEILFAKQSVTLNGEVLNE